MVNHFIRFIGRITANAELCQILPGDSLRLPLGLASKEVLCVAAKHFMRRRALYAKLAENRGPILRMSGLSRRQPPIVALFV